MREDDLAPYSGVNLVHSYIHCALMNGLVNVVKKVVKSDLAWRLRAFWITTATAMAAVFIGVGGGYAFGGENSVYSLKNFVILTRYFPHNFRAHGIILLILGAALLISIGITSNGEPNKLAKDFVLYSAVASMVYALWCFIAYFAAWYVNHHFNGGVFWYFGATLLTGALAFLPPPFATKGTQDGVH